MSVLHSADAGPGGRPTTAAGITATVSVPTGANFLAEIPGGWFGLGIFGGVALFAVVAAAFFTFERRRFARMYPKDALHRHR